MRLTACRGPSARQDLAPLLLLSLSLPPLAQMTARVSSKIFAKRLDKAAFDLYLNSPTFQQEAFKQFRALTPSQKKRWYRQAQTRDPDGVMYRTKTTAWNIFYRQTYDSMKKSKRFEEEIMAVAAKAGVDTTTGQKRKTWGEETNNAFWRNPRIGLYAACIAEKWKKLTAEERQVYEDKAKLANEKMAIVQQKARDNFHSVAVASSDDDDSAEAQASQGQTANAYAYFVAKWQLIRDRQEKAARAAAAAEGREHVPGKQKQTQAFFREQSKVIREEWKTLSFEEREEWRKVAFKKKRDFVEEEKQRTRRRRRTCTLPSSKSTGKSARERRWPSRRRRIRPEGRGGSDSDSEPESES